jgi:hypothetical protein
MLDLVEDIDIDSFLSEETSSWCTSQLLLNGYNDLDRIDQDDYKRPHIAAYMFLRRHIQEHRQSNQPPILQLTEVPLGGAHRFVRNHFILVRK